VLRASRKERRRALKRYCRFFPNDRGRSVDDLICLRVVAIDLLLFLVEVRPWREGPTTPRKQEK